jgi:transcription initiation factor TFIID subunit 1
MFEDDDNYELASTEYPRARATKGRKGALVKGVKGRKPMTQAGRIKAKQTDKRMKKRKKEQEEAELYVPPAKRKTSAHRRERGGGRQRLPHVVFSARLEKIRLDVERFPSSGPFVRPVDRRKFPHYYEKISDPIDLQTIRDKNQKFQYKLADVFCRDFLLMKTNAEKFNGVNHPLALEAARIYDQVKQTIDANRDELTKMEENLQEMNSGGKKKKKGSNKSGGGGNQSTDSNMVDGINFGDVKFDDDSDSGDSGDFIIDQIG